MTYHENGGKQELLLTNLVKIITLLPLKYTPHAWYQWIAGNFYFISIIGRLWFFVRKTCQKIKKLHKTWFFRKDSIFTPLHTTSRKFLVYQKKVQIICFILNYRACPSGWFYGHRRRFFEKVWFFEKVTIFLSRKRFRSKFLCRNV